MSNLFVKRDFLRLLGSAAVAAPTAILAARATHQAQETPRKETVFERVMRTKTLRCGYMLWPMATDMDPNTKKLSGYVPDISHELAKKLGLNKVEWTQEVLLGQQVTMLNSGAIDVICSTDGPWIYSTASQVDYTTPFGYAVFYVYRRADENRFRTIADLNNPQFKLSTLDGDITLQLALDDFPNARRIEHAQSDDPSMQMMDVINRKADAVFMSPDTVAAFARTNPHQLKQLFPQPLATIPLSFSVKKGEQELLNMLNQGFDLLHNLGIVDRALDKADPDRTTILRRRLH